MDPYCKDLIRIRSAISEDVDRIEIVDAKDINLRMTLPNNKIFVVELEGEFVGNVHFVHYPEENKGYFAMLAIDPSHQKKGIAKQVIIFLEKYAAHLGCTVMEIDVVETRSELQKFYQAQGYIETSTKPYALEGAFEGTLQDFKMIIFQKQL